MSSFTRPLTVTKIKKGKKKVLFFFEKNIWVWRVERAFRFYVGDKKDGNFINVEKGYESDGATIPRFLWSIVGHPMEDYAQAAFAHDKGYQFQLFSQKECDDIFLEGMRILEVSFPKRRIMFRALRMFGFVAYNNAKRDRRTLCQ